MSMWRFSVLRPIGITMLTLIVVVIGFVSLRHLPIDLMPDITYPRISISATYSNASPVEVETLVTRPIEQALSAVPGVESVESTSSEGRSQVRVTFSWGIDLDAASNDIRDRLDRILSRLPEEVERPVLRKFDLAAFPILVLGAAGDLDPVQLLRLIEDQVKYRIERIPGVASLDVMGGRKREIHVNLDLGRLKALDLRLEQVVARIRAENLTLPAGFIEAGNHELIVRTPGEFYRVEQLRDVVVKEEKGALVRLGEVAQVDDRWERIRSIVRIDGRPGVRIMVQKQSGRNTVEVADAVMAEVDRINRELPQLHLTTIVDSSKYIKQSIAAVSSAAVSGSVLAVLVLMLFLGSCRSTLVIGTSIPISIIATFVLMYFNGFTLNIMSLGGVALGIGMLVDSSIVVLENIFRLREQGRSAIDAAIDGAGEVAMPIVASTVTTVVIFLPLLFVEGMTGLMFKQLSMVVSFSLLCSLIVSLTLVPMLCAWVLGRVHGDGRRPGVATLPDAAGIPPSTPTGAVPAHPTATVSGVPDAGAKPAAPPPTRRSLRQAVLGFFEDCYLDLLNLTLAWPKLTVLVAVGALAGSLYLARKIPTEFMPTADESEVRVTIEMDVGTRLGLMEQKVAEVERIIDREVPERMTVIASVGGGMGPGGGGGRSGNRAEFRIPLVPRSQRRRSSARIAADLRPALSAVAGARIRTREGQGMFIFRLGASNADKVQVQVRGHNLDTADRLARQVERVLLGIDGIDDVQLSRESGSPERLISIDRQRAADQRLTVQRIAQFLETVLSGASAGNFRESGDEFRILVKAAEPERMSLDQILDLTVVNADGRPVAIRNVAGIVSRRGPSLIERVDQERVINISADPGTRPVGEVLAEVTRRLREIPLPAGFAFVLGGDYDEQQKANRELKFSFLLALLLVFMVMAVQYESLRDPLIVMTTVPFAATGVAVALLITDTTFNVQSFIGCIMLGGIVVNNSIILVDHANLLVAEGRLSLDEAVREAGRDRFRPVLMTALTTLLGLLPLALGVGEGGEVQAPLARVVIGGLTWATAVSRLLIPTIYRQVHRRDRPRPAGPPTAPEGTAAAVAVRPAPR